MFFNSSFIVEFFIIRIIDIPLLKKNINSSNTKNNYSMVKNTVQILRFVSKRNSSSARSRMK